MNRYMDVAGWVALIGAQSYAKIDWYDPVTMNKDWIRFSKLICYQMAFVNDSFSALKELDFDCNYVVFKAKKRGITIDEARSLVWQEIKQIDNEIAQLADELAKLGREDVNNYVKYSYVYIKGNHYWSTVTDRYK
jgi:hypothetical protein